ncbi:MAG TPA: sulfatase [Clostridiales bacterium]|nr:sulfatase [Clostridiales bacterium]
MQTGSARRPNIIVMLSDDQGAWAMGCAGNPEIITPNLDRMAAAGVRFENFFCTSPVCSPARASLLTGRIPSQHGIHDFLGGGNMGPDAVEYLAGQKGYTDFLAEAGYVCGLSGKWHLGDSRRPQKGFSHWYAHQGGGGPYYNAPMIRDGEPVTEEGYLTERITDDALDFLETVAGRGQDGEAGGMQAGGKQPFYLSVHYTAPHAPWISNHPREFVELYAECAFASCPQEPVHPWNIDPEHGFNRSRENLMGYFASITAMDFHIGRILDKVEALGIGSETLLVFLSDNGHSCGQHGYWGKGNTTFPLNMYDTSVKVPAIFCWPGGFPAGRVSQAMVSGYDFMPTLLEAAGLADPEAEKLPGRSFLSVLQGEAEQVRGEVVVFDEYGPVRMIRTREWKYVHRYPFGPHELYDLVQDPGERENLIGRGDQAELAAGLRERLDRWFIRYVDPALDGLREEVTGKGQLSPAGLAGRGKPAYNGHVDPGFVLTWPQKHGKAGE